MGKKNFLPVSLRDGTGRHPGFRNQCTCACRFESDRRQIFFEMFTFFKKKFIIVKLKYLLFKKKNQHWKILCILKNFELFYETF